MSSLPAVILASVATFALTNIDDVVLLKLFFAQRVPTKNVVLGQCLGFAGIVVLSLVGFWAAVLIPSTWLRFLGLLPLAIGIKQLIHMDRRIEWHSGGRNAGVLSIAGVTLANGADNVGVYVPFFAINHARVWIILLVYAALLLLWCLAGKWLGNHTLVLRSLDRYGHLVVPFVFIGLGIYILVAG
jgi:cadmium resistance protein CadD (predicted permease)